jgi:hypothetical protein
MKTKSIGYAYPTSPLAGKLGRKKAGCYYVSNTVGNREFVLASFDTLGEASKYAEGVEGVWSRWSIPAVGDTLQAVRLASNHS